MEYYWATRAHARALGRAGLLTADELQRMEDALDELQRRVDSGAFAPIEDDEDEATALERGLLQIAGDELGGKLRAGRSRNDQIAALIRMWLRRHSRVIAKMLLGLAATLTEQAEKAGRTVMAVHPWGGSLCSLRLFPLPRHDGRTVRMGSHQIRTAVPETAGIQIREPVLFLHGREPAAG